MKDINNRAKELFKNNPQYEDLWVNEKEEFFTSENACKNSKKGKCTLIKGEETLEDIKDNPTSVDKITLETLREEENVKGILEKLTVPNLKQIAGKGNLEFNTNIKKEELINLIEENIK